MYSGQSAACGLRKVLGVGVLVCAAVAIASAGSTLTTLASFTGSDGAFPQAALVQGNDGNFYGTTLNGGTNVGCHNPVGCGTVFRITPSGTLTTLYSFCSLPNCTDGYFPAAALIQGTDGNLYGTTQFSGGTGGGGTVFRISLSGTLTTIYHFCQQGGNCADGSDPIGSLVEGNDGKLYGTTVSGGMGAQCQSGNGCGTVFQLTTSGHLTTLYSFCQQAGCQDGESPVAALVQATDGKFYGTTKFGGAGNCGIGVNPTCGTVFSITSGGIFSSLYSFTGGTDGAANPAAALVQGVDGNLYGTTLGANGTVFSVTPDGLTFTVLHAFNPQVDGGPPQSALVQAGDGNFYGTTTSFGGGASTIFRIGPSGGGTFVTVAMFSGLAQPEAGVIQAIDGNLYGTTYAGGSNQLGTVYELVGPTAQPTALVPVTPCRLVDTRGSGPIQGGTWQTFLLPQLSAGCPMTIPAGATAYSLNVTLVTRQHHPVGYLTIWPAGRVQPYVSTVNSQDGRTKANAAIVPAGASAAVSVYVTDTTDVILDVDGYFQPSSGQQVRFFPLTNDQDIPTPCRVVDTRGANGPLGGPAFHDMEARDLPILSSPCFQNVATQPLAYALNVTVSPNPAGQPLNYLTIWPSDQPQPTVSTLNNGTATVVANAAIVAAASNGDVSVFTFNSTDVIIDAVGYFGTPGGLAFYAAPPCRAYDSRNNGGQPFTGERTVDIAGSPCATSTNAKAYVFNATVVPSPRLPFLTLWPDGEPEPDVSTLNAYDGFVTSNLAIVPNINGSVDADAAQGVTQLILDISGYFAP